jgi:hypothetical protein
MLVGKPEEQTNCNMRRREDNIKIDFKDIGYEVVPSVQLVRDRIQ